jgi:hypothetical protein
MADTPNIATLALQQASGGLIGGAVQAGLGIYQMYQGKKDLAAAKAEIADLRANAPSLAVPSAFSDYYNKAMDRSNLEFQNQQIARRQAGNVAALSRAGGRALVGGLAATEQSAAESQFQAAQQQMQREMQASQVYGAAQQQSQQLQESRYRMDLGMADQQRQSAQANIASGLGAIAGGVVGGGASFADAYGQQSKYANERLIMAQGGNVQGLGLPKNTN